MSGHYESSKAGLKIVNPEFYLQSLSVKCPQTTIPMKKYGTHNKVYSSPGKIEEKILENHFSEHYLDIGGWNPKEFIEINDIQDTRPVVSHYIPIPIQKFEFESEKLRMFESESAPKIEKTESEQPHKNFETEKSSQINPKVNQLLEKMKEDHEDEDLRLARIRAKNKRVFNMVDSLLAKSSKRAIYSKIKFNK